MELILSALAGLPEFSTLASLLTAGETAALSGVGQLPRSHFLAGLTRAVSRPALILCPGRPERPEMPAGAGRLPGRRAGAPPQPGIYLLRGGGGVPGLGAAAAPPPVEAGQGADPIVVSSLEALSLRTMPPAVLFSAAVTLRPGASFDLEDLSRRLTAAGYARTSLVEGVGQFLHPGRHSRRLLPGLRFPPPRRVLGRRDWTFSPSLIPSPSGAPRSYPRPSSCPWPRPCPTSTPRARRGSLGRFKSSSRSSAAARRPTSS